MSRTKYSPALSAKAPKYIQVRDQIAELIANGTYSPGTPLPSEETLREQLNVSRNTLRTALELLRNDNVIASGQGKKSIVNLSLNRPLRKIAWLNYSPTDRNEPVYLKTYNYFLREARRDDVNVMFLTLQGEQDEAWFLEHCDEIDGIVIGGLRNEELSPKLWAKFHELHNLVGIDCMSSSPARNFVCVDNYQGGQIAAKALLQRNYRKIVVAGVIPSINHYSPFAERLRGFSDAIFQAGIPEVDVTFSISECEDMFFQEKLFLERVLQEHPKTEVIFSLTDKFAVRCTNTLLEMGRRIPEEIGILGYDGTVDSETNPLPVSTITHPFEELGRKSYEFLKSHSAGTTPDEPTVLKLSPEFVERQTLRKLDH